MAIGSPSRAVGKKRVAENDVGAADATQRRPMHVIRGADQEFKNKVVAALSDLDLTKEVKVLQWVMDQVTAAVTELQTKSREQDDRNDAVTKRLTLLDSGVADLDRDVNQVGTTSKDANEQLDEHLADLEARYADGQAAHEERSGILHELLATQEHAVNARIDEFKALFVKCDELFADMQATKTAGAPPATSAGGAQLPLQAPGMAQQALDEAKKSTNLLRGTVDALQIEVNQLREELANTQDIRVPLEMQIQEQATQLSSFQQWTLKEVIDAKGRDEFTTKHAAEAFEELRLYVKASACPCPPGCPGKTGAAPKSKGQDPWHAYPQASPPGDQRRRTAVRWRRTTAWRRQPTATTTAGGVSRRRQPEVGGQVQAEQRARRRRSRQGQADQDGQVPLRDQSGQGRCAPLQRPRQAGRLAQDGK